VQHVIIFAPNWLGDAVMALPAIADVRRGSPDAAIAVAARRSIAPFFEMVPEVSRVIIIEKGIRPLLHPFRGDGEVAILFPNSFRAALIALRAGIPERWGYRSDCRGPLLTRAVDRPPAGTHQIDSYQRLVHALGFPRLPAEPHFELPAHARAAAARLLEEAGWDGRTPIAALAPGAAYGVSKRWPPASFAALAGELAAAGLRPIMVGSTADVATGRDVESALGGAGTVLNLIGRTDLPTLAGVLATARVLVSNDSGPMHLGAALGVPVTALFGPTDERVVGLRAARRSQPSVVVTHHVWCRPCWLRECPLDHDCMRGISVKQVFEAARLMV
jgi:lipopolysaccharide heptosyltransferase II